MPTAREGTSNCKSAGGDKKSDARIPSCKRLKSTDRISALPDVLITHILTFLSTRDSIRTGTLSRRWQHLWTHVPNLYFIDSGDDVDDNSEFVSNVNRTLISWSGSKVLRFIVNMSYGSRHESDVNVWTRFASRYGSEVLELFFLYLGDDEPYVLPQHLFTNSSFRELKFRFCKIMPRGPVSWKSLKELSLYDRVCSDDALQNILAGTPALEILNLDAGIGGLHLHLGNSSVKKLNLLVNAEDDESMIFISAPSLQSLTFSGCCQTFRLVDMASLVEAAFLSSSLTVGRCPRLTKEVICSLSNVKTLALKTWVIQALPMLLENDVLSLLWKCKFLTIYVDLQLINPSAIAILLKIAPEIEELTVILRRSRSEDRGLQRDNSNIDHYVTSQEATLINLMNLRVVKFCDVRAWGTQFLSFVRFLLKNARVLQKMTIYLEIQESCETVVPVEVFETAQKLLSFPRSSPDAELFVVCQQTIYTSKLDNPHFTFYEAWSDLYF